MTGVSASGPVRVSALDVSVSGEGSVTAAGGIDCGDSCDARYPSGKLVVATAKPSANESFERWGGDCYGSSPSCGLLLDRATRLRAVFRPLPRKVRITVGGPGTITSQPPGLRCGTVAADCTATFGQGQTIRLIATPDRGARFFAWGGACETESAAGCDLTVGANEPVADRALATFSDATPQIGPQTVTIVRDAGSRVRSDPASIDCGAVCSAAFEASTAVTLSSPSTWNGDCVGDAPRCTIVADKPTRIATHVQPEVGGSFVGFGLTVNLQGRGAGRVTSGRDIRCNLTSGTGLGCRHTYRPGARVTLKASGSGRSRFVTWAGACARSRHHRVCKLSINSVTGTTAIFRP
jgi:hypothetical protein